MAEERDLRQESSQKTDALTTFYGERLTRALVKQRGAPYGSPELKLANFAAYSADRDLVRLGRRDYAVQIEDACREATIVPARQLRA